MSNFVYVESCICRILPCLILSFTFKCPIGGSNAKKMGFILLIKMLEEFFKIVSHIFISYQFSWIQKVQFCGFLYTPLKNVGVFFQHLFPHIFNQFSRIQKVQFVSIFHKYVVTRAGISIKKWRWSSNSPNKTFNSFKRPQ